MSAKRDEPADDFVHSVGPDDSAGAVDVVGGNGAPQLGDHLDVLAGLQVDLADVVAVGEQQVRDTLCIRGSANEARPELSPQCSSRNQIQI